MSIESLPVSSDKIPPCTKIKALLFDFDGLILDTETTEFRVWQSIYREYGHEMLPETWGQVIGGYGISDFDGAVHLAELLGDEADVADLRARFRSESDALILQQPVCPASWTIWTMPVAWDCVWRLHPVRLTIGWIRILLGLSLLTVSMRPSAAMMCRQDVPSLTPTYS